MNEDNSEHRELNLIGTLCERFPTFAAHSPEEQRRIVKAWTLDGFEEDEILDLLDPEDWVEELVDSYEDLGYPEEEALALVEGFKGMKAPPDFIIFLSQSLSAHPENAKLTLISPSWTELLMKSFAYACQAGQMKMALDALFATLEGLESTGSKPSAVFLVSMLRPIFDAFNRVEGDRHVDQARRFDRFTDGGGLNAPSLSEEKPEGSVDLSNFDFPRKL